MRPAGGAAGAGAEAGAGGADEDEAGAAAADSDDSDRGLVRPQQAGRAAGKRARPEDPDAPALLAPAAAALKTLVSALRP